MNERVTLLFFLNAILGSVLDSLEGEFEKSAKYKFNKVKNAVNHLETELTRNCVASAHETYNKSVIAASTVLNKFIEVYNEGNIGEFVEYIENFKTK